MTAWLATWLWQGTAVAVTAGLLLKVSSRANAATRHLVWWGALAAVIWLGCISSPYWELPPVLVSGAANGMDFAPEAMLQIPAASPVLISVFLGVWAAIALVRLLRLIPGLHALYTLRDRCRPFPRDFESHLPLWLEANRRGRRAELALCDAVAGATVLGFLRPCIALPPWLVEALDAGEIDQIVLHEYAHVRRRDDWMRLTQALLQAVLWIHPAVAFIARSLNREREMACDEWVVARTGLPKAFARCLAHAADVRGRVRAEPALAPALFSHRHDLVCRVNRLLAIKGRIRTHASRPVLGAAACAMAAVSIQLNAVPLVGEYAGMLLPHVAAPAFTLPVTSVDVPRSDALRSDVPLRAAVDTLAGTRVQNVADDFADITPQPIPQAAPDQTVDGIPRQPVEISLAARAFPGAYGNRDAAPATSDAVSAWSTAAAPGLAIAGAAQKTGVGLAGAFSRAGVALARRF